MTAREQIKQLRQKLEYREFRIRSLQHKIREQEEELKKIPRVKGELSTLRKKNRNLENDVWRLQAELDSKKDNRKVIGFQTPDSKERIKELEQKCEDLIVANMTYANTVAELRYELKLTKEGLIHISPYGEVPKDIYDQIHSLERQLKMAESSRESIKQQYEMIKRYLCELGYDEQTEEFLKEYHPKRKGAPQKISDKKIETIRTLHNGGVSIRDIAAALGVSVGRSSLSATTAIDLCQERSPESVFRILRT